MEIKKQSGHCCSTINIFYLIPYFYPTSIILWDFLCHECAVAINNLYKKHDIILFILLTELMTKSKNRDIMIQRFKKEVPNMYTDEKRREMTIRELEQDAAEFRFPNLLKDKDYVMLSGILEK